MTDAPRGHSALSPVALGAILVAEGYASLATEILALRRMVPWAGSSVSVTAVLLAVYLAALAGGYRRGGLLARRGDPRSRLAARLSGAGALAAFWLSDIGTLAVFGLPVPPLAQVTAYAIVGIAPVGWLLAESVLLAHACALPREPSETAGGIFALSTAGNVVGALLTTFVLLRFLGTAAAAIVLVTSLFLAASIAGLQRVPVAAAAAMAIFPALDLWVEATQYVERNAYADYRIVELPDGGRMLDVSGQGASRHDAEARGWDYAERIERTLCEAGETRVLVLGAAGMSLGKGAPCALDVTFVDIDPAQERIAELFLGVPPGQAGTFQAGDARAFLRGRRRELGSDRRRHVLEQPHAAPAPAHGRVLPTRPVTAGGRRIAVCQPPDVAGRCALPDEGRAHRALGLRGLHGVAGRDRAGPRMA